jgi:hypothetical protein
MPKYLTPELLQTCELIEAEAHESGYQYAPKEFINSFGIGIEQVGSVSVTKMTAVDNVTYNCILNLGVIDPVTESILDESIEIFKQSGCHNYTTRLSKFAQPADISKWLQARGFTSGRNYVKLVRGDDPAPINKTDLHLERIGKDKASDYSRVVLSVFGSSPAYRPFIEGTIGRPGWHHYVAYEDGKPVSASAMYISGNNAWLGFMCTLETYRGRGAQGAMLSTCITEGLSQGCKWFISEIKEDIPGKPNPSHRNALRNGFELAYLQQHYYHISADTILQKSRRKFFIAFYSLKYELNRMLQIKNSHN